MSELLVRAASVIISKAILVSLFPQVFTFNGLEEILLRMILVYILNKYYGFGNSIAGLAFMIKKGEMQWKKLFLSLVRDLTKVRHGLWLVFELVMDGGPGGLNRFCEKSLAAVVAQEIRIAVLDLQILTFLIA